MTDLGWNETSIEVAARAVVEAWEKMPDRLPDVPGLHELSQAIIWLREAINA